jgi:hypothetical protein
MNEHEKERIMKDAEVYWTPEEWQGQLLEEMGELITAFNHHKRGRCTEEDVISEMVDIQICLDYFNRRAEETHGNFWHNEREKKFLKMRHKMELKQK